MLKLCPAIQKIYQNELKYGNRISVVSNYTNEKNFLADLVVCLVKPIGDYDTDGTTAEPWDFRAVHAYGARGYLCRECKCLLIGPRSTLQQDFFHNENHLVPDERVIATRDYVYWMDEDWEEHQVPVLFTDPIESRKGEPS